MFQTKQVERQPEKQPQKKEASFPSTKASKYLNDTLLKYAKAGDIDAIQEILLRIMAKKMTIPSGIESYVTKLQKAENENAQLVFSCYQIYALVAKNDCNQASKLRNEAVARFIKNNLLQVDEVFSKVEVNNDFIELINKTFANALYEQALKFNSSFNQTFVLDTTHHRPNGKEQTKEAVATLLAAILVNNHPEARKRLLNEVSLINSHSSIQFSSQSETPTIKNADRLKLKAHITDVDPRSSLIAIVYYILDKTLGKDFEDKSNTLSNFLSNQKITTVKSPTSDDYLKAAMDSFVVFNFSKYCYNQGFITEELYLGILEKVSEANKNNIIPFHMDKFFNEQVRILVEKNETKKLVALIDKVCGTDGIMDFFMSITGENEWDTFTQKILIWNAYSSAKKDLFSLWPEDSKPDSRKECLKAAINTINTQLPLTRWNTVTTFANNDLVAIRKIIESTDLKDDKKLDEIAKISSKWQLKSGDQSLQKEAVFKIVSEAKEYLEEYNKTNLSVFKA